MDELTPAEKEVLRLLTEEFLNEKQIRIRRKCSQQAINKHIQSLKRKGAYIIPKDEFTKAEKEILNLITVQSYKPKEIAEKKRTSQEAVYKIIRKLKKKVTDPIVLNALNRGNYRFEFQCDSDNYCYFCDTNKHLHRHHIIKRSHGGTDERENLLTVCIDCHNKIHYGNFYVVFSRGYYFLKNRVTDGLIGPSRRMLNFKTIPPRKSLNIAIKKGFLYTDNGKRTKKRSKN